jgi:endoglycosylceramidase
MATASPTSTPTAFDPGHAQDIAKDGTWFRDAQQRYVLFRGVNFGARSKLPPFLPILPLSVHSLGANGAELVRNELAAVRPQLDLMRELGLNAVRLPVIWKALEPTPNPPRADQPPPDQFSPAGQQYLGLLKEVIDALYARGIFVFLDFHQDIAHDLYGGDGFPDWAIAVDKDHPKPDAPPGPAAAWGLRYYEPPWDKLPFPKLSFPYDLAVRQTLREFWNNSLTNTAAGLTNFPARTHLVRAIGLTAKYFKSQNGGAGHPAVLGYEPFNEPHPVGIERHDFEQRVLPTFYAEALKEIRKYDNKAFVFVEPRVDWTTFPPTGDEFQLFNFTLVPTTFLKTDALAGERVVFSFHHYDPWTTAKGASPVPVGDDMHNKAKEWPEVFRLMREAATSRGLIPFLTELGGNQDWQFDTDLRPDVYGRKQVRAYMDLQYQQVEDKLLNTTYWNFDLYNTEADKDNWNRENFSLLGPHRAPRHVDVVARPYPMRSSARPESLSFDLGTKRFRLVLAGRPVDAPTVVYVPKARHYTGGFAIAGTGSLAGFDRGAQLLQWQPDKSLDHNALFIRPGTGPFAVTAADLLSWAALVPKVHLLARVDPDGTLRPG